MQKSETLISYEGVKRSFEGDITISGGRLLGGVRVSLKALRIYLNGVHSKIEALPRVEIVRCKECKYRYGDKEEPYCSRINPYSGVRVKDEDFCSWGEVKNG